MLGHQGTEGARFIHRHAFNVDLNLVGVLDAGRFEGVAMGGEGEGLGGRALVLGRGGGGV